jgi:hypothetical protein
MSNTPDTGRITLTLKADTIKALRLLALLKDESQNDVAEALLIAGGLHNAVDTEWSAGKSDQPTPVTTAPIPQAAPTTPPDYKRDWMPEVTPSTKDEDPPW